MIRNKKTAFAIYVVLFILMWNLAEILWLTFVDGSGYVLTASVDIATPLIVAIVTGYLFYTADKVNINDELKEVRSTDGAVIIDVRSTEEYAQGHIPGAISVPADNIEAISSKVSDKSTPVFTYCLRGSRSIKAVKALKTMGYSNVINMGGINKYKGDIER